MENIKTKYEERRNEEKNGIELYFESIPTASERETLKENGFKWHAIKKCWYKSNNAKQETRHETKQTEQKKLTSLIELNMDEKEAIAKELWNSPKMQEYLIDKYDFYKTSDGLIIELEKVNKISIDKTMYYDDETEAPEVTENNFILYNRFNVPGRNLEAYLEEKEKLQNNGCASGQYDYNGIYLLGNYNNNNKMVYCNWYDRERNENRGEFKRYLTIEEQNDYIELMKQRKDQYIERLRKYWKRYGQHVTTYGYWANR